MIGSFGDTVFKVSDKAVFTFNDLKMTIGSRWSTQEVINGKPRSQFLGPDLIKVSFDITVTASMGVKPRETIDKLRAKVESGAVDNLVIGGRPISDNPFCLKDVSATFGEIFNGGELYSAKLSLSLEEYV